jgi:hypothetical protein
MTKQLLFYELVTPVSAQRHAKWSITADGGYGFARGTNSVPLTIVEFLQASVEYPIVFSVNDEEALPVAILGLDADSGVFIDEAGSWGARYIPAFVRRFPFVFSASDDGQTFTLCIDEAHDGIDRKGKRGERLFDEAGERTAYLSRMLEFVNAYQFEHQRTRAFSKTLKDLDILEPAQAQVQLAGGARRQLTGFHCVNRQKLKDLDGDKLKELMGSDALELIFLHMLSLRNFEKLLEKMPPAAPAAMPEPATADA